MRLTRFLSRRTIHKQQMPNWRAWCWLLPAVLYATCAFAAAAPSEQTCPRSPIGSEVQQPPELRSHNGVLEVTFNFRYEATSVGQGPPRYCYVTDDGLESPTLRLNPGDQLIIHFHNDLSPTPGQPMNHSAAAPNSAQDCDATTMNAAMTNLHFHGLTVPPTCHQDDVIKTAIPSGGEFDYRMTIPRDEPPGLYWYHPHPHGYSERQVQGGASGALIIEGLEKFDPWLARLPQRVLVLRDQSLGNFRFLTPETPAWDISINYVPVLYPHFQPAIISTRPLQPELWRVVNAGADTIFNLQVIEGGKPQPLKIVAIDGVPTTGEPQSQTSILLPPAARAEFVVETPKVGEPAQLVTTKWDTGPQGDMDPARPIANIVSSDDAIEPAPPDMQLDTAAAWHPPDSRQAIIQRRLYFSQMLPNPREVDTSIFYFITVSGQQPAAYRMGQPPNIVTHEGDVEDWIVENRAPEDHVFHIHQIHFRVLEVDGKPVHENALRDTVNLPAWTGSGPYPSVKLLMDFRDPDIVGTFLYHCHILKHEDMGMMGVIEVLPPGAPTAVTLEGSSHISTATLATIVANVVAKNPSGTPLSGTVQFAIDGITIGQPVQLINGKATFTPSFDDPGEHFITAVYDGDRTYDVSASLPFKLKVTE